MLLPRQPAGRAPASETFLLQEAERHSRRLGKLLTDASNASWKLDELIREVRLASGAPRRDALARLAALLASYGAASVTQPAPARAARFRRAVGAVGSTLASGSIAGLALFGLLSLPTLFDGRSHPLRAFPVETKTASAMPLWPLAVESLACTALLHEAIRRDADARSRRALLIYPVWRH